MSEEKLYMVKNDKGEYWDFNYTDFWSLETAGCYATTSKERAEIVADEQGYNVVTLVEEPEKVVLTKEQAIIVGNAHFRLSPVTFIYDSNEKDEELLMKAYVNGYTVAKEKKYYVSFTPDNSRYGYLNFRCDTGLYSVNSIENGNGSYKTEFTQSEIDKLKQRKDIPIDWGTATLEEVDDGD